MWYYYVYQFFFICLILNEVGKQELQLDLHLRGQYLWSHWKKWKLATFISSFVRFLYFSIEWASYARKAWFIERQTVRRVSCNNTVPFQRRRRPLISVVVIQVSISYTYTTSDCFLWAMGRWTDSSAEKSACIPTRCTASRRSSPTPGGCLCCMVEIAFIVLAAAVLVSETVACLQFRHFWSLTTTEAWRKSVRDDLMFKNQSTLDANKVMGTDLNIFS